MYGIRSHLLPTRGSSLLVTGAIRTLLSYSETKRLRLPSLSQITRVKCLVIKGDRQS